MFSIASICKQEFWTRIESYAVYMYLSRSAFMVSFTDPNKKFPHVKPLFKFLNEGLVCKKYIDLLPS